MILLNYDIKVLDITHHFWNVQWWGRRWVTSKRDKKSAERPKYDLVAFILK